MSIPYPDVDTVLGPLSSALDEALSKGPKLNLEEQGRVATVGPGTALVRGFTGVKSEEVLRFPGGVTGMAFNISRKETGVVLMDPAEGISAGDPVHRTGRVLDTPVGDACLGRVLDGLGRPLDGKGPVAAVERRPIERPAPEIMDRAPVTVPLQTGLKVVDALIPVGRGQRELILGDRQTGKTAIALDTFMNQKDTGVICIYCGVGKRGAALGRVVDALRESDALSYSMVVAATEDDPPGLQFAAPYTAASMAEYFMEQGRDVLVVYDDLTRHARAYRELSLLLRRPPGREAFPGDIFYVHSRLLERSTHLREEHGGGSFTALPVVETEAQNISAYIPTNIISITDGQLYLSPDLFQKGILPAVDVGESVSRVGGKTQLKVYRGVAGDLRLSYSQFEELESFSRFGARLDEDTRATLDRGRRVREILKQPQGEPLRVCEQVAALVAVNGGAFDVLDLDDISSAEKRLRDRLTSEHVDLCRRMDAGEKVEDADIDLIEKMAVEVAKSMEGASSGVEGEEKNDDEEDHGDH